jgi:ribosomal protein S18 acetylase RimI-like enzyme
VYVAPSHRGRDAGVADALLDAVEDWARTVSGTLRLTVHEDNRRAQAFYGRRGYRFTGRTSPYALDETRRELEMRRELIVTLED